MTLCSFGRSVSIRIFVVGVVTLSLIGGATPDDLANTSNYISRVPCPATGQFAQPATALAKIMSVPPCIAYDYNLDASENFNRSAANMTGLLDGKVALVTGADVSDQAAVERMVADAAEPAGGIDIVVSNAGLRRQTPFLDICLDEWHEI